MRFDSEQGVEEITVEAVITRADGTIENLGVIAHSRDDEEPRVFWTGPIPQPPTLMQRLRALLPWRRS